MDVTDAESIRKAFAQAEAEVGTSNVIVNNSGIANPKNSLAMDETDWYNIC
jgi:NAD(P)-dependent dehydrogenase (short-subunit alcohol dehydrogenase family)